MEEEFRTEYVADRVHTMGTAFLGLTLECARCHDHKYDPISQKDYYRFFAFFNNIDESGLYSHFTKATPSPTLLLYRDGVEAREKDLKQKIDGAEAGLDRIRAAARSRFETWKRTAGSDLSAARGVAAFGFNEVTDRKAPNSLIPPCRPSWWTVPFWRPGATAARSNSAATIRWFAGERRFQAHRPVQLRAVAEAGGTAGALYHLSSFPCLDRLGQPRVRAGT